MTEEIAATPGWVDAQLDDLFAPLPAGEAVAAARRAYADCLARSKDPVAPSDLLGAEFTLCRTRLHAALTAAGVRPDAWAALEPELEALEAEIGQDG